MWPLIYCRGKPLQKRFEDTLMECQSNRVAQSEVHNRHDEAKRGEKRLSSSDERISKPKSIRVSISGAKVQLVDDNHAIVTFRQDYKSSSLKVSGSKTLTMVKSEDKWLIQEERSEK